MNNQTVGYLALAFMLYAPWFWVLWTASRRDREALK